MSTTPNLDLPLILPGQAQKHITHNEALAALDLLLQLVVFDHQVTAPPDPMPGEGARYIVPSGASGAWARKDNQIAAVVDGLWTFIMPKAGWLAYSLKGAGLLVFSGTGWKSAIPPAPVQQSAPQFGVNTSADAGNRFAVKADAVLFSHDDVTPGSGDVRLKLNRAGNGQIGTLLFQTAWSARAELGHFGDEKMRLKVSPDGSTWLEALCADPASGQVGFGTSSPQTPVDVVRNAGPAIPALRDVLLRLVSDNGRDTRIGLDAFAASATTAYRRANGGSQKPEALAAEDVIGGPAAWGHGTSGYSASARAAVRFIATEKWTDAAQGTAIALVTTATGGTDPVERLRVAADGSLVHRAGAQVLVDAQSQIRLRSYTPTSLPPPAPAGTLIHVAKGANKSGLACSDGSVWRFADGSAVS